MSIRATHSPVPDLPIATMLAAIDTEARRTVERARDRGVPAVRAVEPARSGRLRRGTVGRVSKTRGGWALTIGPTTRVRYPGGRSGRTASGGVSAREVWRFVDRGTGVFGRIGRPIRPAKPGGVFALPGGWVAEEVQGQRPQGLQARATAAADGIVSRELEQGAEHAARAAERVIR